MSVLRTYEDEQWEVQVWVSETAPWKLNEVYVRCVKCRGGFSHYTQKWWHIRPKHRLAIAKNGYRIRVNPCRCSTRSFEIPGKVAPPWLTRPESVQWYLGITDIGDDDE